MEKVKVLGLALVVGLVARSGYCLNERDLFERNNNSQQRSEPVRTLQMDGGSLTIANHGIPAESARTLNITGSLWMNGNCFNVGGTVIIGNDSEERQEITTPGLYEVTDPSSSELADAITRSSSHIPEGTISVKINQGGKLVLPKFYQIVEKLGE